MGDLIKTTIKSNIWIKIFSIVAIGLILGGFFTPPMAEIDGSILTASGIMFAFATLWTFNHALEKGKDAKLKHKDVEIEVGDLN